MPGESHQRARGPSAVPAPIVALVSWLVPGAGYLLIGQWARGMTVGLTVILLFVGGLLVGGVRVVEAPPNYVRRPMQALMQRPWFVPQAMNGPMALYTARLVGQHPYDWKPSHGRLNEIGTLYTAVAGMLNLLGIIDAAHRAAFGSEGDDEREGREGEGVGS